MYALSQIQAISSQQSIMRNHDIQPVPPDAEGYAFSELNPRIIPSEQDDTLLTSTINGDQLVPGEVSNLSVDAISQRLSIGADKNISVVSKAYGVQAPNVIRKDATLTVIDLTSGRNESLGNDMVLIKFEDGSLRQTQKALYEAANSLDVFDRLRTSSDFANWHLSEWANSVNSDTRYINAHSKFNDAQIKYDADLRKGNPEIAQNRLNFVIENAASNQLALAAATFDLEDITSDAPSIMNLSLSKFDEKIDAVSIQTSLDADDAYRVEPLVEVTALQAHDLPELSDLNTREIIDNIVSISKDIANFETFMENINSKVDE